MNEIKKYIAYYRVSTKRQGESGLGLDAQKFSVSNFISKDSVLINEFVEIESGKNNARPQLQAAIAECQKCGYTLIVAKLDRLGRNVHFVSSLQESKIDFVCVDNPTATPFVIHILAAVAEQEAKAISERTKAALAAIKRRGDIKLGNPRLHIARKKGLEVRQAKAKELNAKLISIVDEIKSKTGVKTLAGIAEILNLRGIKTNRGNEFKASHVWNLLQAA